jgi:hypothetical protein
MANTLQACTYEADDGTEFRYYMNSEILAQDDGGDPAVLLVGNGGATPAAELLRLPSSVKPRRVLVQSTTTKKQRTVVCLSADAPLITVPGTEIIIEDSDGAPQTYTKRKFHAEDFGRG